MKYNKKFYFNKLEKYGSAIIVNKNIIKIVLTIICLITPATNWVIPFLRNIKDLVIRY